VKPIAARLGLCIAALSLTASCAGSDGRDVSAAEVRATTLPTLVVEPVPTADPAREGSAEASVAADTTADAGAETCLPGLTGVAAPLRTDISASGNRILAQPAHGLELSASVDLPARPLWVIPFPVGEERPGWYVAFDDGSAAVVSPDGEVVEAEATAPGVAPEVDQRLGCAVLADAHEGQAAFTNPLPDTRVVESGELAVALVDPTDRYGHGVLGDAIEAGGFEVIDAATGSRTRVRITAPSVIEGVSPMLADLDGDGAEEILVTVSNGDVGAWLAAYRPDGTLLGESDPIGTGRRWRNQLGVGAVGPDGETEIVDVRTPHLGGSVEFFRLDGGRLVRVATSAGDYTSHTIGSRNLDMGLIVRVEADGPLGVLVPTSDRNALAALARTADGTVETHRLELPAKLTTNIAGVDTPAGAHLAVGLSDNTLVIVSGASSTQ